MLDILNEEKKNLEVELKNTSIAIGNVREQIKIFEAKGHELVAHMNATNGAKKMVDMLIEKVQDVPNK